MLKLTETILEEWGKEAVAMIQDNIKTLPVTKHGPMNASGRSAASVRYEISPQGLTIYGAGHIFFLETGRGATHATGPYMAGKGLRAIIRQWIDDKPVIPRDGMDKDTLAFLITRKIHREGTLLHQMGGKSGVLSNVINQQQVDKWKAKLFLEIKTVVRSTLLETA